MAKYSQKQGGKEVGSANVYAEPHTMAGKKLNTASTAVSGAERMRNMNISLGTISKGNYKPEKTDGITIRGVGAATKGIKARGPMG